VEIGEEDGETLLSGLLARSEAPSLAYFVRTLVGLDRSAAQAAFSEFLNDRSLRPPQIRFVEMVIEQLTARGVMEASALYEPPFSIIHGGGPAGWPEYEPQCGFLPNLKLSQGHTIGIPAYPQWP